MNTYFFEGKHYSFYNIKNILSKQNEKVDDEQTEKIINKLKSFYILKAVKSDKNEYSELSDLDYIPEVPDPASNSISYIFTFVGILLLENDILIKCLPKYIECGNNLNLSENEVSTCTQKFKTIIKVLEKYNQKKQDISLYNGTEQNKTFNKIPLALYIVKDFILNGIYSTQKQVIQTNGEGEILWDKTINETFALLQNNTPYYFDLQTIDSTQDDLDFIRRLHQIIITECSKLLQKSQIAEFLELPQIELTSDSLQDLADVDFIKYKLEKEIRTQFITQKKTLLQSLYTYVAEIMATEYSDNFSLFGTTSFNLVWEKALAEIFDNKYEQIKSAIEKPEWLLGEQNCTYDGELKPDIISILESKEKREKSLFILDGKYYKIRPPEKEKNEKLEGIPGIQDVVKQYVYNAALNTFIEKEKITQIANAFLVPEIESVSLLCENDSENCKNDMESREDNDHFFPLATVPFWSVQHAGIKELPVVQVVKVSPTFVWQKYLSSEKIEQNDFKCITTSPTKFYLYSNERENSLLTPQEIHKRTLVGFVRDEYFNIINSNLNNGKSDFIFYCYATSQKMRFPLHPFIDFCTEIICYKNKNDTEIIHGKLVCHSNGRCKIQETAQEQLIIELAQIGYKKEETKSIVTYYKFEVTDLRIINLKDVSISSKTSSVPKLLAELNKDCLNNVLYKFSPKVLEE